MKKLFLSGAFKKYLITGLLIWIPLIITLWVLKVIFDTLDASLLLMPESFQTEHWLGVHIPGLGAILTIVVIFLTGVLATNFVGAQLVQFWHEVLQQIPVVNSIYTAWAPGGVAGIVVRGIFAAICLLPPTLLMARRCRRSRAGSKRHPPACHGSASSTAATSPARCSAVCSRVSICFACTT